MIETAKLIVVDGDADHADQEFPIRGSEFVIGRAASCDLAIDHSRMSMQHCRLVRQGDRLSVHDLRSTYGTLVNGKEVNSSELHDGDLIKVGPATLLVAIGEEPSEARRRTFAALATLRGRGVLDDTGSRGRDPNDDTPLVQSAKRIFENVARRGEKGRDRDSAAEADSPSSTDNAPPPILGGNRRRSSLQVHSDERGIKVVSLLDRAILQDADIFQINHDLDALLDQGHCLLVLDFSNVKHLSSQALGILLSAQKRCKSAGGVLKLCNPNPAVAEIFKIANLRRAVEIYADVEQALASDWPDPPPRPEPAAPPPKPPAARPTLPEALNAVVSGPKQVALIIEVGKSKGKEVSVPGPRFVIGRDPRCQLRPASEAVSRVHTRIDQREGRVYVRDMGTTNGTLVGQRLLQGEEAEAFDGDRIQIGPLIFTLSITGTPLPAARTDETEDAAASWLLHGPAPVPGDTALLPVVTSVPPPGAAVPPPADSAAKVALADFKRIQSQVVGESTLVTILSSELIDEEQIGPVRHELIALLDQPVPKRVVLKLDRVTLLSSLAVAMLMSHFQRLDRFGGGMRLCKVRDEVFPSLESLITTGVIAVYSSADQAVRDPWPIT